jgi:hypothetical protein
LKVVVVVVVMVVMVGDHQRSGDGARAARIGAEPPPSAPANAQLM